MNIAPSKNVSTQSAEHPVSLGGSSAICRAEPTLAVREKELATLEHLMHAAVMRGDLQAGQRYWREIGVLLGSVEQ